MSELESREKTKLKVDAPAVKPVEVQPVGLPVYSEPVFEKSAAIAESSSQETLSQHIAMPINDFYWARMTSSLVDVLFALTIGYLVSSFCVAIIILTLPQLFAPIGNISTAIGLIQLTIWIGAFVGIKTFRGLRDYARTGLRVTDKYGRQITRKRAFARAFTFCLTWWLCPLYLIYMAVGGRRFIHDQLTGTYVLETNENLNTTFYPPVPRWMTLFPIVFAVCIVCGSKDVKEQYERLETSMVPIILGVDSPVYAAYLKSKLGASIGDLENLDRQESVRLLPLYEQLSHFQRVGSTLSAQDSALYQYETAMVAIKSGNDGSAMEHAVSLSALPVSVCQNVLGTRFEAFEKYHQYPILLGASFLMRHGYASRALIIARSERERALKLSDRELYCISSDLVIECLKAEAKSAEANFRSNTEQERAYGLKKLKETEAQLNIENARLFEFLRGNH